MLEWTALIITLLGLGFLVVKAPQWLIPLLGVSVALEISSTWYPDLGFVGSLLGIVSLTRFVSVALILAALWRVISRGETRARLIGLIRNPVAVILLIYLAFGALSFVYSADGGSTLKEVVRLGVLFGVFLSMALLVDEDYLLFPFHAVHLAALALLPLTLYEGITRNFIWHGENLISTKYVRVNATFVDPNIFARFLILGIVANLVLQLFSSSRWGKYFYWLVLPLLLVQLVFTGSRGGILTLGLILVLALVLLPRKRVILGLMGLCTLGGVATLFLKPEVWKRMLLLTKGIAATSPERKDLIEAGIAIFKDHPLLGTGLGTFQTVFLQDYSHLRTVPDGATLSHTTVLTIGAELGVVGLLIVLVFWVALLGVLYDLHRHTKGSFSIFSYEYQRYILAAGYALWALAIFISSQGEGRFFEDPILWLSCGGLAYLNARVRARGTG
ncbi:MAG: polymerase [Desulfitobacterium sp.]|nr:polymerase [Desulfitobacterium sp.]